MEITRQEKRQTSTNKWYHTKDEWWKPMYCSSKIFRNKWSYHWTNSSECRSWSHSNISNYSWEYFSTINVYIWEWNAPEREELQFSYSYWSIFNETYIPVRANVARTTITVELFWSIKAIASIEKPAKQFDMIKLFFLPQYFKRKMQMIVPGIVDAAEMVTLMKMFPPSSPTYWDTPKKHIPHTNQLKCMQMVLSLKFGVRYKSKKFPLAFRSVSVFALWVASRLVLMFSVGSLLHFAAFSRTSMLSLTRPVVNNQRGDSGINQ